MLTNLPWIELWHATWQTLYMVFISSFLSILVGLVLGICLFNTRPHGLSPHQGIHHVLNIVINIGRSIPYIILMIALIPFTRAVVGSSIGINAAIVPLTIAAIPFYARITESALLEVPYGLIEAGHAMGASRWQIIVKILLPESLSGLVKGATLTIISLVGYSAMAGAVGGGGLGELAINYGYQRFNIDVMLATVILLVIVVQCIQWLGDKLTKRPHIREIIVGSVILWLICLVIAFWPQSNKEYPTIRLGIMTGANEQIMKVAQQVAWDQYHFKLQLVTFNDYTLPNEALNNGNIDANIFQHVPYLNSQIKAHHYQLIPIANTFIYPMGFYSNHYKNIQAVEDGSAIAVPNDPSNEGRALLLLQRSGLIQLDSGIGLKATIKNIRYNPHHFKLVEIDAAQIPRALPDMAMGALTNDFVHPAGFTVNQALIKEDADSPYANVIVVQSQKANDPIFKKLIAVIHSKPVLDETLKLFPNGAAIPAWKS